MVKKDYRLLGVATIVVIAGLAAFYYMNSEEEITPSPVIESRPATVTNEPVTEAPTTPSEVVSETPVTEPLPQESLPVIEHVDNVVKEKEQNLERFKGLIQLDINLPAGMDFVELDLDDGVAAMEGTAPGRKMLIMGTRRVATPSLIEGYLKDQKNQIPMLNGYDFKISGPTQNFPGPKNSGISKITVFPAENHNGNQVYAAYVERADKKGSYVFVMEASPSQFSQYEGDFDIMTDSLKTR